MIVTFQMKPGLVIIGIVVRGVLSAIKTGRQRPATAGPPASGNEPAQNRAAGPVRELTGSVTPKMLMKTNTRRRPVQKPLSEVWGELRP